MVELQTPVVVILYNRPDLTQQVFAAVRAARPTHLFLIADGPRPDSAEDALLCAAARAAVAQVDWPCTVERDFAAINLGCGYRVATGLDRVFEAVEEAIILEDDIVPSPAFFPFCQELLARYRDADTVMGIGGRNDLGAWRCDASYFFHRSPAIWGWGTWRRAWRHFDLSLERYRDLAAAEVLNDTLGDPEHAALKYALYRRYTGIPVDTWDVQWTLACLFNNGVWISPAVNLVANLGFDSRATHTIVEDDLRRHIPVGQLPFPLHHPASDTIDLEFDRAVFLLQMTISFKDIRRLRVWQRALAHNPNLSLPGMFEGATHTLAPLRHLDETTRVFEEIGRQLPENRKVAELLSILHALETT